LTPALEERDAQRRLDPGERVSNATGRGATSASAIATFSTSSCRRVTASAITAQGIQNPLHVTKIASCRSQTRRWVYATTCTFCTRKRPYVLPLLKKSLQIAEWAGQGSNLRPWD